MSQTLVSRNEDLSRLRAEGYNISVNSAGRLIVKDVPYVNRQKQVACGTIAMALDLAGQTTIAPKTHVIFFVGEFPCEGDGSPVPGVSQNTNSDMGEGLLPNHQISRKPSTGSYSDFYQKVTWYINIISGPAHDLDPKATARTYPVAVPDGPTSVFNYIDTGPTKAGILTANERLAKGCIAIIGLGGTGSYVLDLVAKTPVPEIHLFDHDIFINHNAFRSPGAPSIQELSEKQPKVEYFAALYSKMRKNIFPHNCYVDETTIAQLKGMSFVFLCIDKGSAKRLIVESLEEWGLPFVDVGMGLQLDDDNLLGGIVTVTTSTPEKREHLRDVVAFADGEADNEYSRNIQIAEISALSASMAVLKWKKHCKYYRDNRQEHCSIFTIGTNQLLSEAAP